MSEQTKPEITDNTAESRFEAHVDGELAGFADYNRAGHTIEFPHTEVDPSFEGQGVGSALVRGALSAVQNEGGLTVVPTCPFVKSYIEKHDEFASLTAQQ